MSLEKEVAEIDHHNKRQKSEHDIHVGIAAYYKNVVNQLNQKHHESLQETNEKGQNWPFEFPWMVQSKFHVSETLPESVLNVNVEDQATTESGQNNWSADWLHVKVE